VFSAVISVSKKPPSDFGVKAAVSSCSLFNKLPEFVGSEAFFTTIGFIVLISFK